MGFVEFEGRPRGSISIGGEDGGPKLSDREQEAIDNEKAMSEVQQEEEN